jgi:tetratricopeptide (TPR) repeat protein
VLQQGFEKDIVEDNSKNWELLAGALRQAQEVKQAIPAMEKAASKSDNGDLYARLGNIYLDADRNDDAIEAINNGLRKGGVKRPDQARLVLGMAYFNTKQYSKAREAFRAAGRDERSEKYARQWIATWTRSWSASASCRTTPDASRIPHPYRETPAQNPGPEPRYNAGVFYSGPATRTREGSRVSPH